MSLKRLKPCYLLQSLKDHSTTHIFCSNKRMDKCMLILSSSAFLCLSYALLIFYFETQYQTWKYTIQCNASSLLSITRFCNHQLFELHNANSAIQATEQLHTYACTVCMYVCTYVLNITCCCSKKLLPVYRECNQPECSFMHHRTTRSCHKLK